MRILFIALLLILGAGTMSPAEPLFDFFLDENRTLHDQGGRVLTVERPFSRMVSLYGAHTENLLRLELGTEIIGVSAADRELAGAADKPVFSYHDDPEKFLAARPDLVLVRPMIDRGYAQLMERLEKSGIAVVSLQPASIPEMYRYWFILGELTGRQAAARDMAVRFERAVAEFKAATESIRPKKRVYFEAMHRQMKTFSPGAMAGFVLEAAGGINIADDGAPSRGTNIAVYGKEKLLSKGGQIDVYLAQAGAMNQPTREMIKNEPGFSAIKAVRDDAIYIVDEQIVSRPTMRLLIGIHRIGRLLYPEHCREQWDQILNRALQP